MVKSSKDPLTITMLLENVYMKQELLPIYIIHYDPVKREIVSPTTNNQYGSYYDNQTPQFFDLGYYYTPYIPVLKDLNSEV